MIGQTVLTAYNNKTYTVHDVDYDKTPRDTFDTRNGPKSYADYYLEKYRITIRNLDQPILV
jgi:aubergine-like protein